MRLAPRSKVANLGTRQKPWEFPGLLPFLRGGGGGKPQRSSPERSQSCPGFPVLSLPQTAHTRFRTGRPPRRPRRREERGQPPDRPMTTAGNSVISRGYATPLLGNPPRSARSRAFDHQTHAPDRVDMNPGGLRRASAPSSSSSPSGTGHPRPGDEHPANLPRRGEPTETGSPRAPNGRSDRHNGQSPSRPRPNRPCESASPSEPPGAGSATTVRNLAGWRRRR